MKLQNAHYGSSKKVHLKIMRRSLCSDILTLRSWYFVFFCPKLLHSIVLVPSKNEEEEEENVGYLGKALSIVF
ncbi:hypothetical protein CFP56_027869 [Quercus suber]|uniref:Uncharacterized protein n=1 Tax=Quercus suber TaxID=58331 RepID=A0AAW0LV11_QUESU